MSVVTIEQVREARARIAEVVRPTPVERGGALDRLAGRDVLLKPEHRQRTGSFKIRGAYNAIALLPESCEVVTASAGNHAQGVALASQLTGHRGTVFMPVDAALPKVEVTRSYGAAVRMEGATVDDAIDAARGYAEVSGAVFIPPFDHPDVIAGQGTVGLELAEEVADVECIVVPVGGGGLISGIGVALAELGSRRPRLVGVEAAGAASMRASLDTGRCVRLDDVHTVADGIAVRSPSPLTLEHVQQLVDDVLTVSEDEISTAVIALLERAKVVVEPAGAAGLAAVLAGKVAGTGPVAVVLSGGNVDPLVLIRLIEHGLTAAGRYVLLRIVLDDRPGSLAALAGAVAHMRLNVLSVEHHRTGIDLPLDRVEVALTLESRDPEHRAEIVETLRAQGFTVIHA